ncbi:hypothetical protein OH76DRAFT_1409448 [Lentinus brumalis]|uniref:Uncharacterized protein n=1 Tax=Lentinus brumalis TaxID=2498619 RepID=A0A371CUZ2_9APHY|nr:hypothetical protein OH76DRAFT_1409448 [Polyporus brumalis]
MYLQITSIRPLLRLMRCGAPGLEHWAVWTPPGRSATRFLTFGRPTQYLLLISCAISLRRDELNRNADVQETGGSKTLKVCMHAASG